MSSTAIPTKALAAVQRKSTERALQLRLPALRVVPLTFDLDAAWDRYVDSHEDATLFHTVAWRDAVRETFGHEAVYLVALTGEHIVGILPMFLLSSRLTGRMLVSVPYGVGGGIVANNDKAAAALFAEATLIAEQRKCVAIDLRSERADLPSVPTVDRYVGFRRTLPESSNEVLAWLPRKARAAARNARRKYELTVHFGDEHLREVWRLYSMSMRRLGSLNYPIAFLERLADYTPGQHWVSIVRHRGQAVAGLLTFLFKDRVMPYLIGTTRKAKRCSAAGFIYLTAMERGVDEGYRIFDFGRTRRENTGSYNFKKFQGFEPRALGYQCYTLPGCTAPNLSPSNPKLRIARKLWTYLPLTITRAVGARAVRHISG